MGFSNYRKESSERSDSLNWAKQSLIDNTAFCFDSIEGCNQNASNIVTHLIERARVDYNNATPNLPYAQNWALTNQYKAALHKFANAKNQANAVEIANKYSTLNLKYQGAAMQSIINNPPLNTKNKTFPLIYYSYKQLIQGKREELPNLFKILIGV